MDKSYIKRFMAICVLLGILLTMGTSTAYAYTPYRGYVYDAWSEAVPSPNCYRPAAILDGNAIGCGPLKEPQDIYIDKKSSRVYILDSGNGRIVVTSLDFKLIKVIDKFLSSDRNEKLNKPRGIFVDGKERIFVADTDNSRVLSMDQEGKILKAFTRPQVEVFPKEMEFKPEKVLSDSNGNVYILSSANYMGAVAFDENGSFLDFYGSNRIEVTLKVLSDYYWKKIFNKEQRMTMSRYVPTPYSNFDIDEKDFVYTCMADTQIMYEQIRKLNPMGVDVLRSARTPLRGVFGDSDVEYFAGQRIITRFTDVDVDGEYIYGLDNARGRIFVYTQNCDAVTVFGGLGSLNGTFKTPSAVEAMGDKIYVLDAGKNNITIFEPTDFGAAVRNALDFYNEGLYEESLGPWQQVLRMSSNYRTAYIGIGKALLNMESFHEAMKYFKLGYERDYYSLCMKEYRTDVIRQNFLLIAIIGSMLLLVLVLVLKKEKVKKFAFARIPSLVLLSETPVLSFLASYRNPAKIMLHPSEGFEELRYKKLGSLKVVLVILAAYFAVTVADWQYTGFVFNRNKPDELNILQLFLFSIILFLIWTMCNWAFCTLFDGKGRFRDVVIVSAYSLAPYILFTVTGIILSNIATLEEGIFITWFLAIGKIWSAYLIFRGMMEIHQYDFKKTLLSIIATIAGIFIIIFLAVLAFTVLQQVGDFIVTIYSEIMLRL